MYYNYVGTKGDSGPNTDFVKFGNQIFKAK